MMKFREITQLTRDGTYRINVSLGYLKTQLRDYEEEYGLDLDVDFQRAHVWTDEQRTAFVEHLLRGGIGSNTIRFNCTGWRGQSDGMGPMVCVDGKQRLTACTMFLDNAIPAFETYFSDYEDKPDILCGLIFRINDLPTRADVLRWYLEINMGGTLHTQEEIRKVKRLLEQEEGI